MDADADAGGSAIALPGLRPDELKLLELNTKVNFPPNFDFHQSVEQFSFTIYTNISFPYIVGHLKS